MHQVLFALAVLAGLTISACNEPEVHLNPAARYCVELGGELQTVIRKGDLHYTTCIFDAAHQCEQWSLIREDCPYGGVDLTGYITSASVFCAVTGGSYQVTGASAGVEQGKCSKLGKTCDVWEYFYGDCELDLML